MQHGEGKQSPRTPAECTVCSGTVRFLRVFMFSVFLHWDQQELKTTDLSSVWKSPVIPSNTKRGTLFGPMRGMDVSLRIQMIGDT